MRKTKTVTVRVTKRLIKHGEPSMVQLCPIALAIRKFAENAQVDTHEVFLDDFAEYTPTKLPKKARLFIKRFDADKPVKPFSFRLKVPV